MPICPECGSNQIWKDGFRATNNGQVQRYLCKNCGLRFSNSPAIRRKNIFVNGCNNSRQIGVTHNRGTKNLIKVETIRETAQRESNIKGQLISFAWHLKKMGRSDGTIKTYLDYLEILAKAGDLLKPEEIKLLIANNLKSRNTKCLVCYAYDSFLKFLDIAWEKPQYKQAHKRAFIPTDDELQLAVNCGRKTSLVFSLLIYETGARVNEAERLEWTDLDAERSKVTIKASKNGNARILTVSKRLINLLLSLPKKEKTVFPKRTKKVRQATFRRRLLSWRELIVILD